MGQRKHLFSKIMICDIPKFHDLGRDALSHPLMDLVQSLVSSSEGNQELIIPSHPLSQLISECFYGNYVTCFLSQFSNNFSLENQEVLEVMVEMREKLRTKPSPNINPLTSLIRHISSSIVQIEKDEGGKEDEEQQQKLSLLKAQYDYLHSLSPYLLLPSSSNSLYPNLPTSVNGTSPLISTPYSPFSDCSDIFFGNPGNNLNSMTDQGEEEDGGTSEGKKPSLTAPSPKLNWKDVEHRSSHFNPLSSSNVVTSLTSPHFPLFVSTDIPPIPSSATSSQDPFLKIKTPHTPIKKTFDFEGDDEEESELESDLIIEVESINKHLSLPGSEDGGDSPFLENIESLGDESVWIVSKPSSSSTTPKRKDAPQDQDLNLDVGEPLVKEPDGERSGKYHVSRSSQYLVENYEYSSEEEEEEEENEEIERVGSGEKNTKELDRKFSFFDSESSSDDENEVNEGKEEGIFNFDEDYSVSESGSLVEENSISEDPNLTIQIPSSNNITSSSSSSSQPNNQSESKKKLKGERVLKMVRRSTITDIPEDVINSSTIVFNLLLFL